MKLLEQVHRLRHGHTQSFINCRIASDGEEFKQITLYIMFLLELCIFCLEWYMLFIIIRLLILLFHVVYLVSVVHKVLIFILCN